MRVWRWLFAVLGWLLVVAAGAAILFLAAHPGATTREINKWLGVFTGFHWVSHWALGLGLLLLGLATLLSPLGRIRHARLLEFPTESGRVQVDITALEDCLARVVGEEEGVIRARVNLRGGVSGKTPLGCTATIWFEAGPDVIGRVSEIQARMRQYYYEVLPIKEPVKVDIRTKLVYQKSGARTVETGPPPKTVTPAYESARLDSRDYSGPQYPPEEGESGGPEEGEVKV